MPVVVLWRRRVMPSDLGEPGRSAFMQRCCWAYHTSDLSWNSHGSSLAAHLFCLALWLSITYTVHEGIV